MMMVVREGRDDAGAELVRFGVDQFERGGLLQMVVQEPGVIEQALQDQGLPAGHRAALTAHDRAVGELGTDRLVRAPVNGLAGTSPLPTAAAGFESARRTRGEGASGAKTPA